MSDGDRFYSHVPNAFSNQVLWLNPMVLKLISFNHLNDTNSQFIMIFDRITTPADGTEPLVSIEVGPNGQAMYAPSMQGRRFDTGLTVALSTTPITLTAQTVPQLECQFEFRLES